MRFILLILYIYLPGYFVLSPGGTLQGFLRQMQGLDVKTVTDLFHDIVSGIAFMHNENIIHADLKSKCPSVLFLYGTGTFVIQIVCELTVIVLCPTCKIWG